ncbi:MAG: 23S rRNA (pseudouridine(1915)-N(3))-methyltransferase RlmH [Erysipelotrichaceae bacterium]
MNYQIYVNEQKVEKSWSLAIKEYTKRLSKYCKVEVFFLKDAQALDKKCKDKMLRIQIVEGLEQYDSVAFNGYLQEFGLHGQPNLAFLIGFSSACEHKLAISQMQFSKGMIATILLEQIYRAYRIENNEPYHK